MMKRRKASSALEETVQNARRRCNPKGARALPERPAESAKRSKGQGDKQLCASRRLGTARAMDVRRTPDNV